MLLAVKKVRIGVKRCTAANRFNPRRLETKLPRARHAVLVVRARFIPPEANREAAAMGQQTRAIRALFLAVTSLKAMDPRAADRATLADPMSMPTSEPSNRRTNMVEIRTHRDHPHSMEERIRNRLKPSAEPQRGSGAQVTVGSGPNRTITTIHNTANTRQHGSGNPGEPSITGKRRDVV
jgi:hypothetical protein